MYIDDFASSFGFAGFDVEASGQDAMMMNEERMMANWCLGHSDEMACTSVDSRVEEW